MYSPPGKLIIMFRQFASSNVFFFKDQKMVFFGYSKSSFLYNHGAVYVDV